MGTRGNELFLCAQIHHTQGAALYSALSFLSFAVAARRRLGHPVAVELPVVRSPHRRSSRRGRMAPFPLDAAFTGGSLRSLFASEGIRWAEGMMCDNATTIELLDARICSDADLPKATSSTGGAAQVTCPGKSNVCAFHQRVFSHLRQRLAHQSLRVQLVLIDLSDGALSHSAAVFPEEARHVMSFLKLTHGSPPQTFSVAGQRHLDEVVARRCAYVFVRFPIRMRGVSYGLSADGSPWYIWNGTTPSHVAQSTTGYAAKIVGLSRAAGLQCAIVNGVHVTRHHHNAR